MISLYAYRIVRSAFLRNVDKFDDRKEAVERMVQVRRKLLPELS